MSWNHRVLRRIHKAVVEEVDEESFQVCEAYDLTITPEGIKGGWTGPITPFGETLEDLKWELESMLKAVDRALNGEEPITETEDDRSQD